MQTLTADGPTTYSRDAVTIIHIEPFTQFSLQLTARTDDGGKTTISLDLTLARKFAVALLEEAAFAQRQLESEMDFIEEKLSARAASTA